MKAPIDIIARHRPPTGDRKEHIAVRWAFAERWPSGFNLNRYINGTPTPLFSAKGLPGAQKNGNGWTINEAQLQTDFTERLKVQTGLPTTSWTDPSALIPYLAFALSFPDEDYLETQLDALAEMRGNSHISDPELDAHYWKGNPPTLDQLHAMRGDPRDFYQKVIEHYQRAATYFLIELAQDFEMARYLGLGFEDVLPSPGHPVRYEVELVDGPIVWSGCSADPADANWPTPPDRPTVVEDKPAHLGYPEFGRFFVKGGWKPVIPLGASSEITDRTAIALLGPRYVPTPTVKVSWTPAPDTRPGQENSPTPLLSRLACRWLVERYDFKTGPTEPEPQLPAGATFESCHPDETLINQESHSFVDGLYLEWGKQPLVGWFAWQVRGIDYFGIPGPPSDFASLSIRDSVPPAAPRPSVDDLSITFDRDKPGNVTVNLGWDAENELRAPDTARFRLYQRWSSDTYVPIVVVEELRHDTPSLAPVLATVRVLDQAGGSVSDAVLATLIGGTLLTTDGEFSVVAAGASAVAVRRSGGRAPPVGDAAVRISVAPVQRPKLGEIRRTRTISAKVKVVSTSPLMVALEDSSGDAVPPQEGKVYLHLPGLTYKASPADGSAGFVLTAPEGGNETRTLLAAIEALSERDLAAWLDKSPALFLPRHRMALSLDPPSDFQAGRLYIDAKAIDDAIYVDPAKGNESTHKTAVLIARSNEVPKPINLSWVPRVWAKGASEYVETARALITWPAAQGALRYEVEQALESALGLSEDSDDSELLERAGSDGDRFTRLTDSAFLPRWVDDLPGRAPTRAVYRVRGISAGGLAGAWTIVALVWVPDVRIAPRPSLLSAAPSPDAERAIRCVWTQPGALDGIGFAVEARPVDKSVVREEDWARIAELRPNAIKKSLAGRFEFTVGERTPGQWQEYRIIPLRYTRDPDDPGGRAVRAIEGRPSDPMRARAEGEMRPPEAIRLGLSSDGIATLRWITRDEYYQLEVRYRKPDDWRYVTARLSPYAEQFVTNEKLGDGETWLFQLIAIGHGKRLVSEPIEVTRT